MAVNKMDDPSIVEPGDAWSKPRFDEIVAKLTPFLKGCGYKPSDLVLRADQRAHGQEHEDQGRGRKCGPW